MRAFAVVALAAALLTGCGAGAGAAGPQGLESPPPAGGPAVMLAAKDIAFSATDIGVPAATPFVIAFENRDGVPHNVSIYSDTAGTMRLFEGITFGGPATRWYPVSALPAGTYVFKCDLHPTMTGTLHAS